ncbi:MAG: M15 family metallopeptidase [Pikeienuella sp.]
MGLIVLAIAVLLAPVVWHLSAGFLGGKDEVAELNEQVKALRARMNTQLMEMEALADRVDALDTRSARAILDQNYGPRDLAPVAEPQQEDTLKENFAMVVKVADRRSFNRGLTVATPSYLRSVFGLPREVLTDDCEPMENDALKNLLVLEEVGPIRVRMLQPAVLSLRQIFRNIQVYEPELYARITSAGALCVRRIRGSTDRASSHAYGLAVDLNIDGELDTLGDGQTQLGLVLLAEKFNAEGWIWGAGFGREDSMHFEVSREKIEQWLASGQIEVARADAAEE